MSRRDEYRKYRRSPEWGELRDSALLRTSGFCQFCGDFAAHVHHVKYPKQFGQEHPHSLVPVCERCHSISHGIQQMEALTDVETRSEISPTGTALRYLLSNGRVYASARSWFAALQVPPGMEPWFEKSLAVLAKIKKDLAGGALERSYLGTPVYRWHVVAEAMRGFDRQWYSHEFKSRPTNEKRAIDAFHDNYERLVSWGYDLQERALALAVNGKRELTDAVSQKQLIEAMKEAVAPRLRAHDDKLQEHDVVITEIIESSPAMRDQGEFITVKQAIAEQGLDASQMPLPGSRETLSGVAGQMLKKQRAEQGPSQLARLDGVSVATEMNTYRRGAIYAVLKEIRRQQPPGLLLVPRE